MDTASPIRVDGSRINKMAHNSVSSFFRPLQTSVHPGYGLRHGSSYNLRHYSEYSYSSHLYMPQLRPEPLPRNVLRNYRHDNDEPAEGIVFVCATRQSVCLDRIDRKTCSACKRPVATRGAGRGKAINYHHRHTMATVSPQRVLRDLIMSDAAEPLRPALREALLSAFASSRGGKPETEPEQIFHVFPKLPLEIRRMIWEAALPSRVLLREDLCETTYRGIAQTKRPVDHTHTMEELWQSDLFYVCVEAREAVQALAGRARDAGDDATPATTATRPLVRHVTTRTRLQRGHDVLYYPWHGSKEAQDRGGDGPMRSHPPAAASAETNGSGSIMSYPAGDVPYGHWASQLRLLGVSTPSVALDMAWLDKNHPDTLAWAVGVDISEAEPADFGSCDAANSANACDANVGNARPRPVPPKALQVVLADLIVPVRILLDRCRSPDDLRLLKRHVYTQPETASHYARPHTDADAHGAINLKGRDFTVLVDLYDDARIEELLSLVDVATDSNSTDSTDSTDTRVFNKAALHRCIGCTRRAWEARSAPDSPTNWRRLFGALVGGRLQAICRPAIVVSVVLEFEY